jgi:hypothetical protein
MSDAYNKEYREIAKQTAKELGFSDFIREGVYSFLTGPTFETVTECRLLRMIGTDATGIKMLLWYQNNFLYFGHLSHVSIEVASLKISIAGCT